MPLIPPKPLREKILEIGGPGAGKTTDWLSIAWWAKMSGDKGRFFVMDTDDEATLHVMNESKYDGMLHSFNGEVENPDGNVIITSVYQWPEYEKFSKTVVPQSEFGDWIVLDFVSAAWQAAQEGYLHDAADKTRGQVLYDAGVQGATGWDMFKIDFNWNCVDSETEILTRRGWKHYDELLIGEDVLGLDSATWTSRWEPLRNIYASPLIEQKMVHLTTQIHDSLTTLNHRWPTFVPPGSRSDKKAWTTTEGMPSQHRITISAPHRNENELPKYSDAFVECVAWFWNEGSWQKTRQEKRAACIYQSLKNADNCARIRRALDAAFPGAWKETYFHETAQLFRVWVEASESIAEVLEDAKVKNPRYSFLHSLTSAQLNLFIDTCIRADGHEKNDGSRTWTQKDEGSVRRFEFACALAGVATRTRKLERDGRSSFGKDIFAVRLLKHSAVTPMYSRVMGRYSYNQREKSYGRASREEVVRLAIAWCPTLDSEIWLARRNGTVYYTGNSINGSYFDFIKPILLESRAHVFMTSEEAVIDEKNAKGDDKEHLAQFGKFKFVGQKKLAYQCRTYLRKQRLARGRVLSTNGKDRARPELNGDDCKDFMQDYLVKTAGWKVTDPE